MYQVWIKGNSHEPIEVTKLKTIKEVDTLCQAITPRLYPGYFLSVKKI